MKFMMNGTLQTLVILQLLISGRSQEVPVDSVLVDMQTSQQIDAAPLTSVMSHYKVETTTTFVESGDMFLSERQNLVAEDSVTENFFIEDGMDGVQGDFGSAERELLEVVKSNPLIPADRIPLDLGDSSATEHSPHIAPVLAETHVIETTLKNDQEKAPEEYSDRAAIGADAGRFAIVAAKENLEKAHRSLELEIIDATIPKVHEQSANQQVDEGAEKETISEVHEQSANQQVDEGAEKETILEVHEQSANQQVDEGAEKTPSQQAETSPQDKTVTGSADSVEEATEVVKAESVDDQSHEDDAMQEVR